MIAQLRAHRWQWCIPLCCACGVVAYAFRHQAVELPFLLSAVPIPNLVALASLVAALGPLYDTFPSLSATFAREPVVRWFRTAGVLLLAAIGYLPGVLSSPAPDVPTYVATDVTTDITSWLLLLALGIASVVVIGDYAWLIVLTVGFTSITLQFSTTIPVASGLATVGPTGAAAVLAVATVACALRGARRIRT